MWIFRRRRREKEDLLVEVRVRKVMEAVERVICSLFYDKSSGFSQEIQTSVLTSLITSGLS